MILEQKDPIYTKACGKVLVAGGYGVLEKNNIGLSLALQNYFYCKLIQSSTNSQTLITLQSPQIHKKYTYLFNSQTQKLSQTNNQQNVFVENALFFSLKYFNILQNAGKLHITLLFDKGFISENQTAKQDSKFLIYSHNYSKTGLGSSACVVVSIVSAICDLMGQKDNKKLINVISQVANLSAQKKIGSNFDISTAVFGTHLYQNILPEIAFNCINQHNWTSIENIDPNIKELRELNPILKNQCVAFMIDVSKGANTRVMVSNFLKNLRNQSNEVQRQFFTSSKQITQNLYQIFKEKTELSEILKRIKEVNLAHRKIQQKFSKITKTPVQPQEFGEFLDQLMANQNVLYVICPGSGGFDALFLLVLKRQSDSYYNQLIQKISKKYQEKLGADVKFTLKQVNIKWDNQMKVHLEQIKYIQNFLTHLTSEKQ